LRRRINLREDKMKPLQVYVDTSVFGGCYDAEFAAESVRFFDLVRAGKVKILLSEVVVRELAKAPARVHRLLLAGQRFGTGKSDARSN
jgi:rRNA-processing protein FCF1